MDYEKVYKEALERAREWYNNPNSSSIGKSYLYAVFPELKESKDDKIRKAIIAHIESLKHYDSYYGVSPKEMVAWLEKQGDTSETIDKGEFAQGVLRGAAINLITWIDYNAAEGNMCLSNMECKDITDALVNCDWDKIYAYIKKKLEKQGEQKETLCDKCKKAQPSHSCQDITALGRCAIEKQGEQKPAIDFRAEDWCVSKVDGKIHNIYNSEVGPKFKVGDWVVLSTSDGEKVVQIDSVEYFKSGGPRYITSEGRWFGNGTKAHLWTIQDAKDGDVLAWDDSKCIALFKNIYDEDSFNSHGFIGHCTDTFESRLSYHDIEGTHPANEEQYDLLFKKMKDAGYEWDANKKELKKFHVIDEGKAKMDYCFTKMMNGEKVSSAWSEEEYNGEDYGIDSLYHAQRILEKTLGNVDGYQTDDGILSHKCAITAVKKLYAQKPTEWSEEDEKIALSIEHVMNCASLLNIVPDKIDKIRVWLKSLKDRYTWKPSDKQMKALSDINLTGGISYAGQGQELINLYNDLKKLMEE